MEDFSHSDSDYENESNDKNQPYIEEIWTKNN